MILILALRLLWSGFSFLYRKESLLQVTGLNKYALSFQRCQEKISQEKSLPYRVRGKVRVKLGIGLGLEYRGAFFRGDFILEPISTFHLIHLLS